MNDFSQRKEPTLASSVIPVLTEVIDSTGEEEGPLAETHPEVRARAAAATSDFGQMAHPLSPSISPPWDDSLETTALDPLDHRVSEEQGQAAAILERFEAEWPSRIHEQAEALVQARLAPLLEGQLALALRQLSQQLSQQLAQSITDELLAVLQPSIHEWLKDMLDTSRESGHSS